MVGPWKMGWVKFSSLRGQYRPAYSLPETAQMCQLLSLPLWLSTSLPLSLSLYFLSLISLKAKSCPHKVQNPWGFPWSHFTYQVNAWFHVPSSHKWTWHWRLPGKIKSIRLQSKTRMRHKNLRTNLWPLLHHFIRRGSSDNILLWNHSVLWTKISPPRLSALTSY